MRRSLILSLCILPLAFGGLIGCGEDDSDDPGLIGAGGDTGTGGNDGTGGTGGEGGNGGGGDCENTSLVCDECVTPEQDPYQACSPYADGCVPFDNEGRVPGYPSNVPVVP